MVSTSTPTPELFASAERYGHKVCVGTNDFGIAGDWNNAYELGETDFVTLAHQDDVYEPTFAEETIKSVAAAGNPILTYTDYFELRESGITTENKLLRIKRKMNSVIGAHEYSIFARNRVFSMGSPICCPSVTYNKKRFPDFRFVTNMRNSMDWEAFSRLARETGDFCYISKPLLGHRIHTESETSENIASGARYAEDFEMFSRYWPKPVARLLMSRYKRSMDSNG
jgi:hypothetical protein